MIKPTKALNLLIISTISCISLTGCDMLEKKDRPVATDNVDIPSTPPLQAGSSVSQSNNMAMVNSQMSQQQPNQQVVLEKAEQPIVKPANVDKASVHNVTANTVGKNTNKVATAKSANSTSTVTNKSIVTNKVTPGTPEATLRLALNTVYFGDAQKAAQYYHITDVPDFSKELQLAQKNFQQTIESITFTKTTFNKNKTQAQIAFDVELKGTAGIEKRISTLKKIKGKWKIVG